MFSCFLVLIDSFVLPLLELFPSLCPNLAWQARGSWHSRSPPHTGVPAKGVESCRRLCNLQASGAEQRCRKWHSCQQIRLTSHHASNLESPNVPPFPKKDVIFLAGHKAVRVVQGPLPALLSWFKSGAENNMAPEQPWENGQCALN